VADDVYVDINWMGDRVYLNVGTQRLELLPRLVSVIRDALAPFDARVQAEGVHHWSVDPDHDGTVGLWSWASKDDPRPKPVLERPRSGVPAELAAWRATLAGFGLEDVQ
jgi:hypothetical protein